MHPALKILAGIAATVVVTRGATLLQGQAIMAELGGTAASAMRAHGVVDGSVTFRQPSHRVTRVARLSGTADAATRAAVIAQVKHHPGIADAVWVQR
jgi:hypothetical protein